MLLNYLLKACWNSNFRASRGTKISKFSGALPLDPVEVAYSAPRPPSCLLPRCARSNRRPASLGWLASLALPTPRYAWVARFARYQNKFSWEKSFFHSHACLKEYALFSSRMSPWYIVLLLMIFVCDRGRGPCMVFYRDCPAIYHHLEVVVLVCTMNLKSNSTV